MAEKRSTVEARVITLAACVGNRWAQGAGVVKAVSPFASMSRGYRSFLKVDFVKSRWRRRAVRKVTLYVFTSSHMTYR